MNKVILKGRLTRDPELKQTQSGSVVARFTVATDRVSKSEEKQADFISCVAFSKTAEFISKYFAKGKEILCEGNLRTGSYSDSKYPDVKHYTTDVWVERVEFCGSASDANTSAQSAVDVSEGNYTTHTEKTSYNARQTPYNANESATAKKVEVKPDDFEEIISDTELPF